MYDKTTAPEIVKHICQRLQLPFSCCKLLSADRSVCVVNDEWIKNLHRGQIVTPSGAADLDACVADRYLSRSCKSVPAPWSKVTVKAITKSDAFYDGLPGQCLQRQWSCGSLYEFMSHITKENTTNLWVQAYCSLKGNASHQGHKCEAVSFTDVVRQLLRRLNPTTYINLQSDNEGASNLHSQLAAHFINKTCVSSSTSDYSSNFSTGSSSRSGSFYTTSDTQVCHGVVPIDVVVETDTHFLLVQPYYQYTLRDAVTFSPAILETSHAKPLFIVYQLLHAMHALHNHGLRMGDIQITDIVMDKNMWLRVTSPRLNILHPSSQDMSSSSTDSGSMYITAITPDAAQMKDSFPLLQDLSHPHSQQSPGSPRTNESMFQAACEFIKAEQYKHYEISMLDSIVDAWVHRHITNFQYLMILNHLAGRNMGDPNNHPVLPWVLDFSGPDSGFRDLTKSKFRLNKGDGQLDFTYTGMIEISDSGDHVPHHVSDILSDITYYVYKARRTPKSVLCAHVRSNWVPHEYPISMQRLQDWTPDECIPEFFTDPSIFDSIHEDLPDLEIPPWSKNTVDFVVRHLAALESDHVSSELHHWIDLTFGYKLSGFAAVKAKNVHLHLVDQHTYLTPHGAAQLFQQPHPQREPQHVAASAKLPRITRGLLNSQLMTYGLPDSETDAYYSDASFDSSEMGRINQAAIHLPRNYNPLSELEQCETLLDFKSKALHVAGAQPPSVKAMSTPKYQDEGITEDMVTLMCLVCEMFLDSKLRMQDTHLSLYKRFKTIRRICAPDFSEIQRPLQRFICDMFESLEMTQDKKFVFQAIFPDGSPPLTPGFLIQPYSDLIPFPPYFSELYTCLSKIEEKTHEIEKLRRSSKPVMERSNKIKQLEREKVPILESFLWRNQGYMGSEGMGLILPYIQDLLQNEFTTVQAAWSLFDVTTRELGPTDSTKQFLPSLTALFTGESSSAKHIKLYHRSFLIQLIIRLGLKTFLSYFSTLLVEAVAGYKDFSITSRFYPEELLEELDHEDIIKSPHGTKAKTWCDTEFGPGEDFADGAVDEEDAVEGDDEDSGAAATVDVQEDSVHDDNEHGDMVDRMSLDGAYVLLEDEKLDLKEKSGLGDLSERGSVGSESSDDRVELPVMRRRVGVDDEQEGASGGPYGSADQHSIHSISLIMPKNRKDSPNIMDEMEPFGINEDSDPGIYEEISPTPASSFYPRGFNSGKVEQHSEPEGENKNSGQHPKSPPRAIASSGEHGETSGDDLDGHSKTGDMMSSQETLVNSRVSSPKHFTFDSSKDDSYENGPEVPPRRDIKFPNHQSQESKDRMTTLGELDEIDSAQHNRNSSSSANQQRERTVSDMVRSETEDLMLNLSSDGTGSIINIRDIAADSVKWLCHKLGPVLATKFLSRNLVRMLALCYLGQEQLQFVESSDDSFIKTARLVEGDKNANKVLECIGFTVVLYGEQVILIQCLPNIMDMITVAQKRLSPRAEGGLIASVVLLCFLIPYLSDSTLMNLLEDSIIYNCITPVVSIITSPSISFPGGALSRFVLCHKLIDLMYTLGLRLGFEMTRKFLTSSMLQLFDTFSSVHGQSYCPPDGPSSEPSVEPGSYGSDESFLTIKMDLLTQQYKIGSPVDLRTLKSPPKRSLSKMHSLSSIGIIDDKDDYVDPRSPSTTAEKNAQELKCVFSPELAQALYIPLCRTFGSIHMEETLHNEDLIRQLCSQHDTEMDLFAPKGSDDSKDIEVAQPADDLMTPTEDIPVVAGIGSNVAVIGNRIQLNETPASTPTQPEVGQFGRGYKHNGILAIHLDDLRSAEMEQNKSRHLRGHWLAYWERELGLHERDTMFNFMQIELQTFVGHTSSIRSLHCMDTENCFISASKDKTVRLWSINSCGDGMKKQSCQFCYTRHKKSVFSVTYVESMRHVASCDSTVHIWDPYTGMAISQLESPKYAPVVALTALPAPSTLVATATTEATLRFLDMRTSKYTHGFRCSVGSTGLIRCVVVSPDSSWVAVGFSTGIIVVLDVNSGILLHYWKAHDGEILQLKAYNKSRLLSSAFDQTIKLWNVDTGQEVCATKAQSDPVHCLCLYRDQLLSATTANRISVYSSITDSTAFTSSKLRSATFKGVLTHMSVLPLNKALLLGADNGTIRLMA